MRALSRRRTRAAGAVAAMCLSLFAFAPGSATAAPLYPAQLPDPFYHSVAGVAGKAPGDVLQVRPMPAPLGMVNVNAWQVQYRSTNSAGAPITAVTTVLAPQNKAPNGPLLSYQPIINALGMQCAPSQALWNGDPNVALKEAPALNLVLQRGWTVAIPDHLGPTSAYGAAKLGGQITLDGIRAVQRVPQLQLAGSPIGLAGYSGGGMATGWAAALAPNYAPELKIAGIAMGGVPMNIRKMAEGLGYNSHPAFGLAFAAALGLEREYPDRVRISPDLTPAGLALRDAMANACTNDILRLGAGGSAAQMTTNKTLASDPSAGAVVNENSLELFPGVPRTPVFEWDSPSDALIPVDSVRGTMGRYCGSGVRVQSVQLPGLDHLTAAAVGLPQAFDYLNDRFNGVPAPSNC